LQQKSARADPRQIAVEVLPLLISRGRKKVHRFGRLRANGLGGWLMAILLILCAFPANAQTFPALTGRVVDAANIIPDGEEAALIVKLKSLEDRTDRQLVVASVPSLEGYPIEDYANRLFRSWGLGQKETDNGVLLLVAPNDRKVRIEVGYGLEPILTDAWSSVIINTLIIPQFRVGNYSTGIDRGVNMIIRQLVATPEEAARRANYLSKKNSKFKFPLGTVIFNIIILSGICLYIILSDTGFKQKVFNLIPLVGSLLFLILFYNFFIDNAILYYLLFGLALLIYYDRKEPYSLPGKNSNHSDSSSGHSGDFSSNSSTSSGGFSGGGGSSGGGGASGGW
jgi:uncharacterized protein